MSVELTPSASTDSPIEAPVPASPLTTPPEQMTWWERLLDAISDHVNPILVKESRQALKSRQFVLTFSLLLICCWGWSVLGVALRSPNITYIPGGRFMLAGYAVIQMFPLVVIIPFAAYRSLAAEREDGTYELLSISSLRPYQIIAGKLGSATLQMAIYLSVLAPCMAFTYLLRGVDIFLIVAIVLGGALLCLVLSALGLMLGTLTQERHWQVLMSVLLVLLLGWVGFWVLLFVINVIAGGMSLPFADPEFRMGASAVFTALVATAGMFFLAATARITSPAENRSTALRIGMVCYHFALMGWCVRFWLRYDEEGALGFYVILGSIVWALFGAMMMGEHAQLSPRVRRSLPNTILGRVFFTLFYPGSGTGYLFMIANASLLAIVPATLAGLHSSGKWPGGLDEVVAIGASLATYLVIYLGLTRLVLRRIARFRHVGPVQGLVMCAALVMLGVLIPLVVQYSLHRYVRNFDDYTLIQLPNLFWTTREAGRSTGFLGIPWFSPLLLFTQSVAALVCFINLRTMSVQLTPAKSAVPRRVAEENDMGKPPLPEPLPNPLD